MQGTLIGPKWIPAPEVSLTACLERAALEPQFPWLAFHNGTQRTVLTFGDALELSRRWAEALSRWVGVGDRVALCLPNGPDFVGALFGAFRLGAVAVPLPWPIAQPDPERLRASALPFLTRCSARALVTTPSVAVGASWPLPVLERAALQSRSAEPQGHADAPAFIQFTSGSTSTPRGAVITHRSAVASAWAMAQALELTPRDVGVSWLPFFHDMGLVGVLFTSLIARFSVQCLPPGEFLLRPRRWLELLSEHRATLTSGPNFGYALAARRVTNLDKLDLSHLRCALNGSEPVHRSTLAAIVQRFSPVGLSATAQLPVYGLAEATLGVAFASPAARHADLELEGRSIPSVGRPLAGLSVRIGDGSGPGPGRIYVRGPTLMQGYFDDANATDAALHRGWLDTGDLGAIRDGALYVTGREKELIVKAGQKFHPYEIEALVNECVDAPPNGVAAFSVLDTAQGTEALVVVAELRRQSHSDGLEEAVRGKLLSELGVRADRVELVPAGTLPRTTSGKLRREAARAMWTGTPFTLSEPSESKGRPKPPERR
jgi:acyl-CoA synthetase (AMP-forming)/AMP-acid ligase II